MDDEEEAELRNPFPSPPSHYLRYTSHNLKLLALLRERAPDDPDPKQHEILHDQIDVPDWPLKQLEKPRIDWILEEPDAYYEVFGDRWSVREKIASLADLGGHQLYPADPGVDRRPALLSILRSMLVTYSMLTSSLLAPPPTTSSMNTVPEWHRHIEWITILAQNMMAAANDLRPVQARATLEAMMTRQLELRRQETATLHSKCDAMERKLAELRGAAQEVLTVRGKTAEVVREPVAMTKQGQAAEDRHQETGATRSSRDVGMPMSVSSTSNSTTIITESPTITIEAIDVFRWAEESLL